MDKLTCVRVFCRIVELGGFAPVAREMNLSAMTISKYIAHLEQSLGVSLLNRTTRRVSLTEAGEAYLAGCRPLLEQFAALDESVSQLAQDRRTVQGTLKISAPIDFGGLYMVDAVNAYQQQFPNVKAMLYLQNADIKLAEGVYDVAVVVANNLDPGVIAKQLAVTRLGTYAAPDYLARYGEPHHIDELDQHRCLHYIGSPHEDHWLFQHCGQWVQYRHHWHFASNHGRALCQAAALGMGIAQAPEFAVRWHLQQGLLTEILTDYRITHLAVYATYLQKRYIPAKTATFVNFLVDYLRLKAQSNQSA
ncbi:MAG: LysR family transcriptional regulator [Methylococcales bacterium]|nr:LysR family transcriptional regulator [Methylococcales bacterium]